MGCIFLPPQGTKLGSSFPPSASQRKKESVNIQGTQVDGGHPMFLKVRSLISSASPPIPCSISSSSQEGPASADETIEDPAPEGHPVAGPAQLRPFVDGIRHAIALEGKAAHQPSQILAQTTLNGGEAFIQTGKNLDNLLPNKYIGLAFCHRQVPLNWYLTW